MSGRRPVFCLAGVLMDGFDRLPDCLIVAVFNSVADVKTLVRCRSVSKRFNSLVPQTDSLFLKIDRVVSSESNSLLVDFFKSAFKSLHGFIPQRILPLPTISPVEILRGFKRIRRLKLELPSGDVRLDGGMVVKWKAEFGKSLKKSVILGFNAIGKAPPTRKVCSDDFELGKMLKTRIVWTVKALMAAAASHKLLRDVAAEHGELERIEIEDKEEEGRVIMGKKGIKECRECRNQKMEPDEGTKKTIMKMKMREEIGWVELKCGAWVQGGTLVVVGPTSTVEETHVGEDDVEDEEDDEVALEAFDGVYREIVGALVKKGDRPQSCVLEMNGF